MERVYCRGFATFYSHLSGLRDGGLAGAEAKKEILSLAGFEFHSRALVGSAEVCLVVDLPREEYLDPDNLSILDPLLRLVTAVQASLSDWLEGGSRRLLYPIWKSCMDDMLRVLPAERLESSTQSYAVVVPAVVLLSLVYQYLTGNVDIGTSKAYSRSSLDFRDIYVAIVLFLGAYVWIKFREVAFKGVHPRKLVDKRGRLTKVVYEPRFKPPRENGIVFQWIYLGQYATPEEASILYQIAAFYYNRDAGLLEGWFQVPPMSEEERSLIGLELRAWVIGQARKVYEDFKKKKAEAEVALVQELFEAWEDQVMPEQDEVNADFSTASLLNSAEHQQPAFANQVENSGLGKAMMLDNHGLECAYQSFDGIHEGLALPNGHSLVNFQEGSTLPASQLPPNIESEMSLNGSDQWDLLQTRVSTQQQQISLQQQQISDQQQQISLQQRQIEELGAQMVQFQNQQRIQQQLLQDPGFKTLSDHITYAFRSQQLQDVNQ